MHETHSHRSFTLTLGHNAMIQVSPESQSFLDRLVASGQFKSREAAVEEAIHRLRDELQAGDESEVSSLSADEWCERFEAWSARHRELTHEADDSRESIYAGRGE